MYKTVRQLLFKLPAEKAHSFTVGILKSLFQIPFVKSIFYASYNLSNKKLERKVFGLTFKNPVGLAAGFDKDGILLNEMAFLGFGFVEVGTVTPKPQHGNEKPRLFRLPDDQALINRMGFNNQGLKPLRRRLKNRYSSLIVGGNIGKNKDTPNDIAIDDYLAGYDALHDVVDYIAINVSSPNTPGLRALQDKAPLYALINALQERNNQQKKSKPMLLKIAPDLSHSDLDDIVEIVLQTGLAGVIATNTTVQRENLKTTEEVIENIGPGGLSGAPLRQRSTEVIRYVHTKSKGAFPIIGVGGIMSADDAIEKLEAGATLVQLYTGFIYEGPGLVKKINEKILENDLYH